MGIAPTYTGNSTARAPRRDDELLHVDSRHDLALVLIASRAFQQRHGEVVYVEVA